MKNNKLHLHFCLIICGFLISSPHQSFAQAAQSDFQKCSLIEKTQERLACFDSAAKKANEALPEINVIERNNSNRPVIDRSNSNFARENPNVGIPATMVNGRMRVVIVSWHKYDHEKWVFTTADGQVWRQMDPAAVNITGDTVGATIKELSLGGFRMRLDGTGWGFRVKQDK